MRVSGIDCVVPHIEVKEGVELPKFIRTITVETAKEEQEIRLFLTGALSIDNGSNALAVDPDVSNGSRALGNEATKYADLKFNYSLEEKLRIIDTLASILKRENSVFHEHTKETKEKLLALIRSI
ncbi:hypothetical protein DJ533_10595 [Acinetobacter defluvii]|uniref:Uncharacterized protein n=1 Tax=Acinetobacter defluvii TaxID=1871111 RepID=A0A2S2FF81_9GAMM|nr:hypothetical protein [Acinetobacter defluvii]AWL28982.1 hypothetical protein DJ533_10595 [Acinetobacter defluvii]